MEAILPDSLDELHKYVFDSLHMYFCTQWKQPCLTVDYPSYVPTATYVHVAIICHHRIHHPILTFFYFWELYVISICTSEFLHLLSHLHLDRLATLNYIYLQWILIECLLGNLTSRAKCGFE